VYIYIAHYHYKSLMRSKYISPLRAANKIDSELR